MGKSKIVTPSEGEIQTYGLGHVADVPDPRDWKVGALLGVGGSSAPGRSSGVAKWASSPLNQGQTGSCVGHAITEQLYCRMGVQGLPQVLPSPFEIYWNGRARDGWQERDEGSRPRSVYLSLKQWGYCSYTDWPSESVGVNQQPPWRVIRLSVDQADVQFYACDGIADLLVEQVKSALHNGYPIAFAMSVDQSYMDYAGGIWTGMKSASKGGHMQCALEYDLDGVWVQNSWGGWGVSGRAQLSWDVVRKAWRDVYAVNYAMPS